MGGHNQPCGWRALQACSAQHRGCAATGPRSTCLHRCHCASPLPGQLLVLWRSPRPPPDCLCSPALPLHACAPLCPQVRHPQGRHLCQGRARDWPGAAALPPGALPGRRGWAGSAGGGAAWGPEPLACCCPQPAQLLHSSSTAQQHSCCTSCQTSRPAFLTLGCLICNALLR